MEFRIIRWGSGQAPTESELRAIYLQEGLSPYAWSNAPHDIYPAHAHAYHKVINVLRGSITWTLPQLGQEVETFAGDRLELPRGMQHAARVGARGVTCLEAHLE